MERAAIYDILKTHNLKKTQSRVKVLELLDKAANPLSAEEIFIILNSDEDCRISLSTVYRMLESFRNTSLISKLTISDDKTAKYEICRMQHKHHLICGNCRKVIAIEGCPLGLYEKELEKSTNYSISGHKLELTGLCPSCKEKSITGKL